MTVSEVYEDHRKPLLPYTITIRYGMTMSLIQYHHFPTHEMAEQAAAMIRAHGLDTSPWPSHFRPLRERSRAEGRQKLAPAL